MKERPILFSGEMVRAILDGRKTQTRRLVTPQPQPSQRFVGLRSHLNYPASEGETWAGFDHKADGDLDPVYFRCPYGAPGDRLWVRETFHHDWKHNRYFYRADADDDGRTVPYLVSGAGGIGGGIGDAVIDTWTPSIHMPRRASRLTLEVVAVRVERLQDITEADAEAEGLERNSDIDPMGSGLYSSAREEFAQLWNDINGKRAPWASNPWVWVVTFKPL